MMPAFSPIEVFKFGGSSVANAERIGAVTEIISTAARRGPLVVVTSAISGVTNALVDAANAKSRGAHSESIDRTHRTVAEALGVLEDVETVLDEIMSELAKALRMSGLDVSGPERDALLGMGERLAAPILAAAVTARGEKAVAVDATEFLLTDAQWGDAWTLGSRSEELISKTLTPFLAKGVIPIVTGYCGRAPDGRPTTLGRGGSDSSATILAAALNAKRVTLWSDVAGVMTADPRLEATARVIPHLAYREAAELSFHGAKVLHPRAMIPVARREIPVWCRSSFEPDAMGTLIDGVGAKTSEPVKACSAGTGHALMTVTGKGMVGLPGVAAAVLERLAAERVNVTMLSQACSEVSISIGIDARDRVKAVAALEGLVGDSSYGGAIEEVTVEEDEVAMVAIVGQDMVASPGVAERFCRALARERVNIIAMAQGSSEWNITAAISADQKSVAIRSLHREFGLGRLDTGAGSAPALELCLLGVGQIAGRFLDILKTRSASILERYGVEVRVVCVVDRSGFIIRPQGLSAQEIDSMTFLKNRGQSLASMGNAQRGTPTEALEHCLTYRFQRPLVLDLSDHSGMGPALLAAREMGADIVSANKGPFADESDLFRQLMHDQRFQKTRIEATVGAGLPVVDTLQMVMAAGDQIRTVAGCLSGTLAFVMDRLGQGDTLSSAVSTAMELGYTEPDPAVDLSGQDVLRKAIILSRLAGWNIPTSAIRCRPLVDDLDMGLDTSNLRARLESQNARFAEMVSQASRSGACLRYVAKVESESITVGLERTPLDHPLAGLRGTDNMVVFESERYQARPLVIMGPGAGPEVTAMGVFADMLRIVGERGGQSV